MSVCPSIHPSIHTSTHPPTPSSALSCLLHTSILAFTMQQPCFIDDQPGLGSPKSPKVTEQGINQEVWTPVGRGPDLDVPPAHSPHVSLLWPPQKFSSWEKITTSCRVGLARATIKNQGWVETEQTA